MEKPGVKRKMTIGKGEMIRSILLGITKIIKNLQKKDKKFENRGERRKNQTSETG
jgi:hypothetical protein